MQELNNEWDERLDACGIDAMICDLGRNEHSGDITIIFKETVAGSNWNDDRFTVEQRLYANADFNHYRAVQLSAELTKRGIEDIWVTKVGPYQWSSIQIKVKGDLNVISVMRCY